MDIIYLYIEIQNHVYIKNPPINSIFATNVP